MQYWYLIFPLIGALIGFLLNSMATRYFFKTVLPKQKTRLAEKIGSFAAQQFSFDELENKVNDPQNWEKIKPVVENHIDDFLRFKLGKEMPMISMFIGDKTIDSLKKIFMQEIGNLFPQVIGQFAGNVRSELNIETTVVKKINAIPADRLNELLYHGLKKPVSSFKLLGALTGFILGVIQVVIMLLLL